jgi:hypothetical protein
MTGAARIAADAQIQQTSSVNVSGYSAYLAGPFASRSEELT